MPKSQKQTWPMKVHNTLKLVVSAITYMICLSILGVCFSFLHYIWVSSLPNRPLSTDAVLRFNPMLIPNVTKVRETSVRFDDDTLKDSSDRKVQVPKMSRLIVIMALISLVMKGCLVL